MSAERSRQGIVEAMDRICSQQRSQLYIVLVFYLDPVLIAVIAEHLEPDEPPVGAVGRYRSVPVFPNDPTHDAHLIRRSEGAVEYTFMELLSAD